MYWTDSRCPCFDWLCEQAEDIHLTVMHPSANTRGHRHCQTSATNLAAHSGPKDYRLLTLIGTLMIVNNIASSVCIETYKERQSVV